MAPPSGTGSKPGRALAVLAALLIVLFVAIVGSDIASPGKWHSDFRVHLGLDLTSGTTVTLKAVKPHGGTPSNQEMQQALSIMQARVDGAGLSDAQVAQQGNDIINVAVPGKDPQKVVGLVSQTAELQFRQVLLEAPNTAAPAPAAPSPSASAPPGASTSPSPSPSGKSSPSAKSSARPSPSASGQAAGAPGGGSGIQQMAARSAGAATASPSPSASGRASPSASAGAASGASASPSAAPGKVTQASQASGDASLVSAKVKTLFNKLNCANKDWKSVVGYSAGEYNNPNIQTVACGTLGGVPTKFALAKPKVVGKDISSASAGLQQNSSSWQVNVTFNGAGKAKFAKLTAQMYDKYGKQATPAEQALDSLAIVLDGKVQSAPTINQAIPGGRAQITGGFTQATARQLANVLSYGALPLTFHKQSVQSVSPQLGKAQLNAGLLAGAVGLLLVVIYALLYYRGLAAVAVSSLAIAAALIYEAVVVLSKYQGLALDLAGIAGLIVAIGITADSFVVYFERLRDEVREGRSLRAAVERGWTRARRTILVADAVSFLAAALLYYFAVGSVKGFAFTLGLTTIVDIVVVFLFTKPMVTLLARTKFYGRGHRLSGLDPARLGARSPWRGSARPPSARAKTTSKEA